MISWKLKAPVVLIIFKRPDTTEKVFEVIRKAKPAKLFVIADGPRGGYSVESERCEAARAIIDTIDWECEVIKNYSETNMGCQKCVSSGLDWVFEQVEEAIILEDDCVPDISFFSFCEELLERYKYDERIMSISGLNDIKHHQRTKDSYYFSLYNSCWGWATWKRAWKHYDYEMKIWPQIKTKGFLNDLLLNPNSVKFWTDTFKSVYDGHQNTWAYRWKFACWVQNGLSIIPHKNLIYNIGFGEEATNTKSRKDRHLNMLLESIEFPLKHPPFVIRDIQAEIARQRYVYDISINRQIKEKLKQILKLFIK